ncbi:acyltransferase family protein [Alicyclobacillus vulcanalis]|uniref:Peptidoglycan-N-acetylmuramate O-acetyltransferase n=1 Tax=Alicyclobacillus vulcanalis TaxID=252246 RepID=A0A1N7N2X3_9BACL|nr:acyltransferase family protein [Alicyclobacillus vulcanalis]SIS92628.1 peptidoglycan-N-acetylmuramate O-acetyltransferase [Alicyclobacillus vulcanalis]
MPKPMGGHGRYMPGLDGLRALAVLAVIAYHVNWSGAPGGLLGVQVFFVLSGYLITDLLVSEWRTTGRIDFKQFWLRRARRLLPALVVMLVVVMIWVYVADRSQFAQFFQDALASLFYVSNWWFIFHKVSYFQSFGRQTPLGHLWSLAVEEQFYLIWPLLLLFALLVLRRRGRILAFTGALALASAAWMAALYQPGMDPTRVYDGTDTRAFGLLIGAMLAFIWPSSGFDRPLARRQRTLLDLVGAASLITILWMIWQTNEYEPFLYRGGLLILSIATAGLVACLAHPSTVLGRCFGAQPWRWIGVRSYGIYLWHFPIIALTTPLIDANDFNLGRAAWQVALAVAISAVSWRVIEEPIRRLGKRRRAEQGAVRGAYRTRRVRGRRRLVYGTGAVAGVAILFCAGMTAYPVVASLGKVHAKPVGQSTADAKTPSSSAHVGSNRGETTKGSPSGTHVTSASHASRDVHVQTIADAKPKRASGAGVTAIGDSVMIDVEGDLEKLLPGIVCDGQVGRQMYEAPQVIQALKAKGKLGHIVILELGTNGPFTKQQLVSVLQSLGPVQKIVLVNTRVPRPWQNAVNQTLAEVAATYPHVVLVNWYQASAGHPEYFWQDGVHLNPTGAMVYAKLVAQAVEQ